MILINLLTRIHSYVSLLKPYSVFTFQKSSNSNNYQLLLLLFDGLWEVRFKSILLITLCEVLWLNFRTREEYLDSQFLLESARFLVIGLSPINPINGLLLAGSRWCAWYEMLWPQGRRALREECGPKIYSGKRTKLCNKDGK